MRYAYLTLMFALAACDKQPDTPQPPQSPPTVVIEPTAPPPVETGTPFPEPTAAKPAPEPAASLDKGALNERRDPQRVLRFYAAALAARDWTAAAKAWGEGSGVTGRTLKAAYDRPTPPRLQVGKGEGDAGAGSQFYEAPVTLRFGADGPAERGSLFLRRVNDVDGATPGQLRWHIERSTIGAGDQAPG
jgi:hypothetical protein